jgi:TonB family protein
MDSLAIEFAPGALNAIKVQVIRGCKQVTLGRAEVGGLLCGAIVEFPTSTVVRIDSIIPVRLEPPDGRASHLSNTDKWYLSKAVQDYDARAVIGWYRSQTQPDGATPESGEVILDEDRSSSLEFFPRGKTAFLICYPDKDFNLPGRLCIWSAGKDEVVTGVSLGPCAPVPSPEPSSPPARFSPGFKAMAETLCATAASLWPRNSRVLTFALPPIILIAAFIIAARFRSTTQGSLRPKPASLGMKAYRVRNEIFLNWNRYATEIVQAENANLTIVDDGRKRKLKLSPNDLLTGSLTCPADGDDVRIELDVVGRSGDFVESLRIVGESPGRMPDAVPTVAEAGPQTAGIKQTEHLQAGGITIPDEGERQQSIAPPRPPEVRTATVAASQPKVAVVLPQVKAKPVAAQPVGSTVKAPDPGPSRALIAVAPVAVPPVSDKRRVVAQVTSPAAAIVAPEREKTHAGQLVPGKPVPRKITPPAREAPRIDVQPPPKNASNSVVSVVSKASTSLPPTNRPVANPQDLPRPPVREQLQQAKTFPREKAEEYVRPRAIQSVQPSFDDSAKVAIDRALSQNNEAHEVRVQVNIDEHGSVVQASVASTTGPFASLFVDSALDAARRWQFMPARIEGRPVASSITLRFNFVRKPH